MEKAYDVRELGKKIRDRAQADGLMIAEEAAEKLGKAVYFGVKEWAKESAALSDNKVDDFIANFYDQMDAYVIPQIEKIDLDKSGS